MAVVGYRAPNDLELAFLRVVTRGFPELVEQIESCTIADYDPTGWCYVRATCGPPSLIGNPHDGPTLKTADPNHPFLEIILWTNDAGMLKSVEIVDYGLDALVDEPYRLFVDAANNGRLDYRFRG
ncbi:MAG: hypothetical protein WA431_03630 [Candidatus Cybelea sp.]